MYFTGWGLAFVLASATGFWALILWRLVKPFHCQCGRTFWRARALFHHLLVKHGYHEPK
jgi:hypothetical protein